jgi:hypothetical protein
MLRLPLFIAFLLLTARPLHAQRQWSLSDSTHYAVGGDTTLIASRHVLYRALPGDTVVLRDFTDPQEPEHFIRDVDHWSSSAFHVIVGSRTIGQNTTLFRSSDAGLTWQVDSSFYDAATEPPSLNQMTIVGDTAYLFNGYYISEVLRSFDQGGTWQNWFTSLIAHYYGLIPCGSEAYIFGMVGDAFSPSMWQVPETLWTQQNTWFMSGCHNGGAPGCQYAPSILYEPVVQHFDSVANALCTAGLSVNEVVGARSISLYPNPAGDQITAVGLPPSAEILLTDLLGRSWPLVRDGDRFGIHTLAPGRYLLSVLHPGGRSVLGFLKL